MEKVKNFIDTNKELLPLAMRQAKLRTPEQGKRPKLKATTSEYYNDKDYCIFHFYKPISRLL